MYDFTIKSIDGTTTSTVFGGATSTLKVNLGDVALVFLDATDTSNTLLKFKVINNYSYSLSYKYFIRFREFITL